MAKRKITVQSIPIGSRIKQILEEIRIVLPGTQILLGFQLSTVFQTGFTDLTPFLRYIFLGSLTCTILTTILLIAPVAYDRVVEKHDDLERVYRFATIMIISALISLSLSLAGSLFIVVEKITGSLQLASGFATGALLLAYALWFVYTGYRRKSE